MKEQATNQALAQLVQVSQTKRAAKLVLVLNRIHAIGGPPPSRRLTV